MLKGFVLPLTEPWGVAMAVGAVGANIMPHNLVLHSGALLGAREAGGWGSSAGQMRLALLYARVECFVLLLLTVAANEAVVATFSHFASADCAALGCNTACSSFDSDISNWVVSHVVNMEGMFYDAGSFDQPLNSWVVWSVTNMGYMFYSADSFDQPFSGWDVSSVTNMGSMFSYASSFDQPLNAWVVSRV